VALQFLGLPGCYAGAGEHWLDHWSRLHGVVLVAQHDWQRPLRGDWMIQLEEAVLRHAQVVLVADGLGAHLVAAWASHSRQTQRVAGTWLVASPALETAQDRVRWPSWHPLVRAPLPFPAWSVGAEANAPVQDWGAQVLNAAGPSPADPAWMTGWQLLQSRLQEFTPTN
jgi:predicted alpha/beta hydrolase family esterase